MDLCDYISKHVTLPSSKTPKAMTSRLAPIYNSIASAFSTPINTFTSVALISPQPTVVTKDFQHIPAEMRIYMTRCKRPIQVSRQLVYDSGHEIDVHIWFPNRRAADQDSNNMFHSIWKWFMFCFNNGRDAVINITPCSKKLTVYLYMIPIPKTLPKRPTLIDRQHVNGGFSYPCKTSPNSIYIFRKEEWFKVLIHETLHTSLMDFSTIQCRNVTTHIHNELFPGVPETQLVISETYVEIWATVLAILIKVYQSTQHMQFTKVVIKQFHSSILYEKYWSMIQTVKVLQHQNLRYQELLHRGQSPNLYYREGESNVFSYYILKSIVCVFLEEYISTLPSEDHNGTMKKIQFLGKFIVDHGKLAGLLKLFRNIEGFSKYFDSSLRMTIVG